MKKTGLMVGIALMIVLLSVVSLSSQKQIVITAGTMRCVWTTDNFVLQWRHSVERQLWQEHYSVHDNVFLLSKVYVQSFGAGVPTSGQSIPAPHGFVGMKSDVKMPAIHWTVSRRMQGEIMTAQSLQPSSQQPFKIYRHVDDYTVVNIQLEQHARAYWWWQRMIHHVHDCQDLK